MFCIFSGAASGPTSDVEGEGTDEGGGQEKRTTPDFINNSSRDDGEDETGEPKNDGAGEGIQHDSSVLEEEDGVHKDVHGTPQLTKEEHGGDQDNRAVVSGLLQRL